MGAGPRITPQPPPRHALIRLTPLIDVIFILLIFFMLASTLESREQIIGRRCASRRGRPNNGGHRAGQP